MPTNVALVDFPNPDQSRQVIAAWDRLLRDNDLPANLVREKTIRVRVDLFIHPGSVSDLGWENQL